MGDEARAVAIKLLKGHARPGIGRPAAGRPRPGLTGQSAVAWTSAHISARRLPPRVEQPWPTERAPWLTPRRTLPTSAAASAIRATLGVSGVVGIVRVVRVVRRIGGGRAPAAAVALARAQPAVL